MPDSEWIGLVHATHVGVSLNVTLIPLSNKHEDNSDVVNHSPAPVRITSAIMASYHYIPLLSA